MTALGKVGSATNLSCSRPLLGRVILGGAMRCISCCGEMRVVRFDQDSGMQAAGYEHQTLECSGCNKSERRLAFTGDKTFWPAEYWRPDGSAPATAAGSHDAIHVRSKRPAG